MTVLGLILARGGSKRVPRKNVRPLGIGRPLIVWTIAAAKDARCFDRIVVSSDDAEILSIATELRVTALERPSEMATDEASPYPAILHALDYHPAKHVCLLQPTSPFRNAFDINYAMAMYLNASPPTYVHLASFAAGRPAAPNGAIYIGFHDWLRNGGNFDDPSIGTLPRLAYRMPGARSLDIDTEEDWAEAERMLKAAA